MPNLSVFLRDFARAFYSPRGLYTDIHKGHSTPSWLAVLLYCAIYVAYTAWGAIAGVTPPVEPLLKIDPQRYYLVQSIYEAPLVFALWVMAAGSIHALGKLLGGRGNFDPMLVMTGYSLWAPWFILLPFDIFIASGWIYDLALTLLIVWTVLGTTIATWAEHGISWWKSLALSVIAILAVSLLLFTLIR